MVDMINQNVLNVGDDCFFNSMVYYIGVDLFKKNFLLITFLSRIEEIFYEIFYKNTSPFLSIP